MVAVAVVLVLEAASQVPPLMQPTTVTETVAGEPVGISSNDACSTPPALATLGRAVPETEVVPATPDEATCAGLRDGNANARSTRPNRKRLIIGEMASSSSLIGLLGVNHIPGYAGAGQRAAR